MPSQSMRWHFFVCSRRLILNLHPSSLSTFFASLKYSFDGSPTTKLLHCCSCGSEKQDSR